MKTDWKEMLSSVYGLAADSKNFLFDVGLADSIRLPVPVLSVGNLSMGGTGKTPVVQKILSLAQERNIRTAVVARNYKAKSRGVNWVNAQKKDGADYYGDEAFLIAQNFPEALVFTGPRKYQTAQEAFKRSPFQFLIVDDGFQHRSLARDFDLVLLDATSRRDEDRLVPNGRLREGFSSLRRASAVALTKVNWADPLRVEELKKQIPEGIEIFEMEFHVRATREVPLGARILAVSGIAKPQTFQMTLEKSYSLVEHLVFPDHHPYQIQDVRLILEKVRQLECTQVLVTEKDFVKLQNFEELREFLNPVSLSTEFKQEPKGLYAFLDRSFRH